jgi:hypothetical protein
MRLRSRRAVAPDPVEFHDPVICIDLAGRGAQRRPWGMVGLDVIDQLGEALCRLRLARGRSADGVGESGGEVSDVCDQLGWFVDLEAEAG